MQHNATVEFKVLTTPHTLKSTYVADVIRHVEVFWFDGIATVHSPFSPFAYQVGQLMGFDHEEMISQLGGEKGYYYAAHLLDRGGYLGAVFPVALDKLIRLGHATNKRRSPIDWA